MITKICVGICLALVAAAAVAAGDCRDGRRLIALPLPFSLAIECAP